MPSQCPNCGAARYAFEKEIALTKAWEIAADADRKSAVVLRASAGMAQGRTRDVLEALAREEEAGANEAAEQPAEPRAQARGGTWRGSRRSPPLREVFTPAPWVAISSPAGRRTQKP